MVKVKMGAVVREVSNGALKWYKLAGWKVLSQNKEKKVDKTDSKEVIAPSSDV